MNVSIYERTITPHEYLSQWNTNPVLIYKFHQLNLYFIFNYYYINKDILASHIKAVDNIYSLLNIRSN